MKGEYTPIIKELADTIDRLMRLSGDIDSPPISDFTTTIADQVVEVIRLLTLE